MPGVVPACVLKVNVAVTGCVPEIDAGCVVVQEGGSAAPEGLDVMAQVSATLPVNPPVGVIVTADVPLAPGCAMFTAVAATVNDGVVVEPWTVSARFAVSVVVPPVPVTVNAYAPGVVPGCVFTVSVAVTACVPEIAGGCVAEQVGASTAPDGLEVVAQVSDTLPVNPPVGVIVTVEVPLPPGEPMFTGVAANANDGVGVEPWTVSARFAVSVVVPHVPVTVTV